MCFFRLHQFVYSGRHGVLGDYDDDGIDDPESCSSTSVPCLILNSKLSFFSFFG